MVAEIHGAPVDTRPALERLTLVVDAMIKEDVKKYQTHDEEFDSYYLR